METLVAAVDHAFDAIMITDADLAEPGPRIVYVNAALCRMTGYAAEELIGRTPRILQGPRTDRRVMERLRADLLREGTFQGQAVNYRRDGSTFTMEWSISTLRDAAGDARFHVAVQRDVTTFRRLLANAERQARTDPLTGLDNRRAFDARLTAVLANRRVRDRVGLIALDIDHFKSVNDAHGHATGDLVLQEVARRVRRAVGRRGTVARTGGEEMAVILVDAPDLAAVADLADRVRVAIAASPVEVVSGRLPVTASLGVAHATAGGRGAEALAACADRALYRSKADGRNRVTSAMPWTEAHARAS